MTKTAKEVSSAFERLYQRGPLQWSNLLQVDPDKVFQGALSSLMKQYDGLIRRGHTAKDGDQAIVERFNRTFSKRLFGFQYAKDFIQDNRSIEWILR